MIIQMSTKKVIFIFLIIIVRQLNFQRDVDGMKLSHIHKTVNRSSNDDVQLRSDQTTMPNEVSNVTSMNQNLFTVLVRERKNKKEREEREREVNDYEVQANFVQFDDDEVYNFYYMTLFTFKWNKAQANYGKDRSLEDRTTVFPVSLICLKWSLIIVGSIVPLILLPILFMFTRSRSSEEVSAISEHILSNNDDLSPQCLTLTSNATSVMQKLPHPVILIPTISGHDSFLNDPTNCQLSETSLHGLIQMNSKISKEPFYYLDPKFSLQNIENGQLYNLPSGLVFNPIHEFIFHPEEQVNVQILTSSTGEPQLNQVYNPKTNKMYERCMNVDSNSKVGNFFLPRQSPTTLSKNQTSNLMSIRRVYLHELPPILDEQMCVGKLKNDLSPVGFSPVELIKTIKNHLN